MEMEITFGGGKKVDASYDGFIVRTDQSKRGGGDGSAPEPLDLFFASMGTCAGIYVLSFCQNHDLPWEGIRLVQKAVRDPGSRMFEELTIEIQVPDDFPTRYHMALVRAAEQCTVKRHVSAGLPRFEVALVTY